MVMEGVPGAMVALTLTLTVGLAEHRGKRSRAFSLMAHVALLRSILLNPTFNIIMIAYYV
jgi:hypothetical protein